MKKLILSCAVLLSINSTAKDFTISLDEKTKKPQESYLKNIEQAEKKLIIQNIINYHLDFESMIQDQSSQLEELLQQVPEKLHNDIKLIYSEIKKEISIIIKSEKFKEHLIKYFDKFTLEELKLINSNNEILTKFMEALSLSDLEFNSLVKHITLKKMEKLKEKLKKISDN